MHGKRQHSVTDKTHKHVKQNRKSIQKHNVNLFECMLYVSINHISLMLGQFPVSNQYLLSAQGYNALPFVRLSVLFFFVSLCLFVNPSIFSLASCIFSIVVCSSL